MVLFRICKLFLLYLLSCGLSTCIHTQHFPQLQHRPHLGVPLQPPGASVEAELKDRSLLLPPGVIPIVYGLAVVDFMLQKLAEQVESSTELAHCDRDGKS